jgi:DNA-binding LacI/PurR family transcriptional regulator
MEGKYLPGEKLPTEKEIAAEFKASRPTVGRAMRDLEQHGMLVRRQGSGTFVRKATHSRTQTFGILIPWQGEDSLDSKTSVFAAMVPELSRISSRSGYTLLLNESPRDDNGGAVKRAKTICRQLIELQVAGVFFMPIENPVSDMKFNVEIAESFERAGIAVVLLDRDINEWSHRSKYDVVAIDNEYASYMLTRHLLQLGCRRVDFLTGVMGVTSVMGRIEGFWKALREAGIACEASRVLQIDPTKFIKLDVDDNKAELDPIVERIRSRQTEAIVCVNDMTAIRLMQYLLRIGISIPDDVRIVGFDDSPIDEFLPVPLTTIRQNVHALAYEGVRTLKDRIEKPDSPARDVMVATELIIRKSCGS